MLIRIPLLYSKCTLIRLTMSDQCSAQKQTPNEQICIWGASIPRTEVSVMVLSQLETVSNKVQQGATQYDEVQVLWTNRPTCTKSEILAKTKSEDRNEAKAELLTLELRTNKFLVVLWYVT
jgi:hypothetical protein